MTNPPVDRRTLSGNEYFRVLPVQVRRILFQENGSFNIEELKALLQHEMYRPNSNKENKLQIARAAVSDAQRVGQSAETLACIISLCMEVLGEYAGEFIEQCTEDAVLAFEDRDGTLYACSNFTEFLAFSYLVYNHNVVSVLAVFQNIKYGIDFSKLYEEFYEALATVAVEACDSNGLEKFLQREISTNKVRLLVMKKLLDSFKYDKNTDNSIKFSRESTDADIQFMMKADVIFESLSDCCNVGSELDSYSSTIECYKEKLLVLVYLANGGFPPNGREYFLETVLEDLRINRLDSLLQHIDSHDKDTL